MIGNDGMTVLVHHAITLMPTMGIEFQFWEVFGEMKNFLWVMGRWMGSDRGRQVDGWDLIEGDRWMDGI